MLNRMLPALIAACCLAGGAAHAQSSADIVNALRPTPDQLRGPTRGIRPLEATPDAPPRAAPAAPSRRGPVTSSAAPAAPVQAPASERGNPTRAIDLIVQFRTGSADLTPQAERQLKELGTALSSDALATYRFRVEGHTDTVGRREENQALSEKRAQTVVSYLETRFGIPAERLVAVGMGQDHPAVATGGQVPEERNRRVQIVNLGA